MKEKIDLDSEVEVDLNKEVDSKEVDFKEVKEEMIKKDLEKTEKKDRKDKKDQKDQNDRNDRKDKKDKTKEKTKNLMKKDLDLEVDSEDKEVLSEVEALGVDSIMKEEDLRMKTKNNNQEEEVISEVEVEQEVEVTSEVPMSTANDIFSI